MFCSYLYLNIKFLKILINIVGILKIKNISWAEIANLLTYIQHILQNFLETEIFCFSRDYN
mgnify:CR=1 FL=1